MIRKCETIEVRVLGGLDKIKHKIRFFGNFSLDLKNRSELDFFFRVIFARILAIILARILGNLKKKYERYNKSAAGEIFEVQSTQYDDFLKEIRVFDITNPKISPPAAAFIDPPLRKKNSR